MWMLIPLLLVPLVVMGVLWAMNRNRFTAKEFVLLEGAMIVLLVLGFMLARWGAVVDTEIWNGRITDKDSGTQKCCHCHEECDTCYRTGSDGKRESYRCRCREVCQHSRDYWWSLDVSTGDTISDGCSGFSRDPGWWASARVGEPASVPHVYTNYLLADPDSVLIQSTEAETVRVPSYPQVYDRYKVTRFFAGGTRAPTAPWDAALDVINADLGKPKQVNVIVVATTNPSPTYADAVEQQWLFGKKNDVVFVLGAPDGETVTWAKVVTISNVEMLKLTARDEMPGMRLSDVDGTAGYIRNLVESKFTRTPMAEYEYLWAAAQPSLCGTIFLYVIAIVGSLIGSVGMISVDLFGDEKRRHLREYLNPNRW